MCCGTVAGWAPPVHGTSAPSLAKRGTSAANLSLLALQAPFESLGQDITLDNRTSPSAWSSFVRLSHLAGLSTNTRSNEIASKMLALAASVAYEHACVHSTALIHPQTHTHTRTHTHTCMLHTHAKLRHIHKYLYPPIDACRHAWHLVIFQGYIYQHDSFVCILGKEREKERERDRCWKPVAHQQGFPVVFG